MRAPSCPMAPVDPADSVPSFCAGDVRVLCRDGYAIERIPCGAFCVVPEGTNGHALCSLSSAPDPACTGRISTCIDGAIVACEWGFPTRRAECPGRTACTLLDPSSARGNVAQASEAACLDEQGAAP